MSVNKVILMGCLGKDPELTYAATGNACCRFSVATTEKWKSDGETKEKTTWHNIVFWGKTAEIVANYFKKGNRIFIEGKIDNYTYDKKDGSGKGYSSQVIGQTFSFIDGKGTKDTVQPDDDMGNAEQPVEETKEEDDSDLPF
jgi:single-strand DNA-binding protein